MPTAVAAKESKVDVLVIGAGPAGLMSAFALARAGINVQIVDKRSKKVAAGQADGIQPRTTEVFKVTLHQGAIEDIFLDNMRDMGVEVSRPVIPTSLEVTEALADDFDAYPVRVVLEYENTEAEDERRTEIVYAKYVLGADGAHSWVRKYMGIAMEGEQTEYVWGVVDLVPDTDFPDVRNKCAIHSNNGSCMIIPREDDKIRLYIQLDGKDVIDATGRVDKSKAGPEMILDYELERRRYAQDLIDFDKKFSTLFSGKPYSELNLDGVSHVEFLQAFQTFGGFTSGLGVQYPNSMIIDAKHQNLAQNIFIGRRLPPRPLLRAADCRPIDLHDLLVSDVRFKLLVFTGDTHDPAQMARVQEFAKEFSASGSFFAEFSSPDSMRKVFDIVPISSEKKETIMYNALPRILWSHWSKVLVDDIDMRGVTGSGKVYESLGINAAGAVIVVRPDGYVAAIAPLDGVSHITSYFTTFMKAC
ncbi:hypothetical protein HHX47_DHR6000683 [Lentinula edodes]|nr:hypothetical protein HHX47_DHR6000683 [Lentinula edodes]